MFLLCNGGMRRTVLVLTQWFEWRLCLLEKKGFVEYAAAFILDCLFDVIVNAQVGGKRKGRGVHGWCYWKWIREMILARKAKLIYLFIFFFSVNCSHGATGEVSDHLQQSVCHLQCGWHSVWVWLGSVQGTSTRTE